MNSQEFNRIYSKFRHAHNRSVKWNWSDEFISEYGPRMLNLCMRQLIDQDKEDSLTDSFLYRNDEWMHRLKCHILYGNFKRAHELITQLKRMG